MKFLYLLIIMQSIILFSSCTYTFQQEESLAETFRQEESFEPEEIQICVDSRPAAMSKPLERVDNYIMVPIREFSSLIGAEIYWDQETNKTVIMQGDYYLEYYIGVHEYSYGSYTKGIISGTLEVAPKIIDGTAYAPLRSIAEKLGFSVEWEEEINTISLTSKETVVGYANTQKLFLEEIEKHVKETVAEFTIDTENLPIEILEINIADYFDDVYSYSFYYIETEIGKTSITYIVDYHLDARILYAHKNGTIGELDEKELEVYEKAMQVISENVRTYMTDYEKEIALHDYIVLNTRYSKDVSQNGKYPEDAHTAYGVLIEGSAVCEGYSRAFKLLLELSGIECHVVSGTTDDEEHAWNIVKLNKEYYLVDVTWDDPDNAPSGFVTYKYFNITEEMMSRDHITTSISDKKADSTFYNYYYYNQLVIKNQFDFDLIVKKAIADNAQTITAMGRYFDVKNLDLNIIFKYYPYESEYIIDETSNIITIFLQ